MNDEIRQSLDDEILSELESLSETELGSDQYKMTVDGLTKLIDRSIESRKIDIEIEEKEKDRKHERDLKLEQLRIENEFKLQQQINDQKDRWIGHSINAAGILIPTFITVWGTYKTLRFEEHGTVTTIMGRGFINKLLPKSKI